LDFVFKGGTSLLLLLDNPRRLSVDVDIVSLAPPDVFAPILSGLINPPFKSVEEDLRGEDRLPRRRHFKFFYQSQLTRAKRCQSG
jgi:predicted nucleotidyltransferase component of viral defense system